MTLRVSSPSELEIALTRDFDAPRHLVFAALTQPDLLKRWYGARGWHLSSCSVDLRVGGAYRFVSQGPDGQTMAQSGVYREIVRAERLVFTEVFDDQSYAGESLITTVLTERQGRTTMATTVLLPSRRAREIVDAYPMERGAGESYDRLAALLKETP